MPIQLADCRFPGLAISVVLKYYIFQIRKLFYQTEFGNCHSLKYKKCRLHFKKKTIIVSFIVIFDTLSFPVVTGADTIDYFAKARSAINASSC